MKAMWVALAAVVLASGRAAAGGTTQTRPAQQAEAKAPLAALPSALGPHIERIKALGDNQWLNLGKPRPDPEWGLSQGRAWTTKMAFAPDLRGAFLYGEGKHAGTTIRKGVKRYNDDLWFYDINAHAWICILPGTDVANFECRLDAHGFEVDVKTGQHVLIAGAAHGYEFLTYDTDQRKLVMLALGGMWWPMVLGDRRKKWLDWESKEGAAKYADLYRNPFYYEAKTGRWERRPAKGSPAKRRGYSALVYIPSLRQFVYYGRDNDMSFFDYATATWTVKKPTGPPTISASDGLVCLDEGRDRLYVFNPGPKSIPWVYDIKANAWIDPQPKTLPTGGIPPKGWFLECNESTAHYDSANDVIVVNIPRLEEKQKGMYVYDVRKNEWTTDPVTGPRKGGHSFYDPELNAHFFYDAADSSTESGNMWVYRYKRAPAPYSGGDMNMSANQTKTISARMELVSPEVNPGSIHGWHTCKLLKFKGDLYALALKPRPAEPPANFKTEQDLWGLDHGQVFRRSADGRWELMATVAPRVYSMSIDPAGHFWLGAAAWYTSTEIHRSQRPLALDALEEVHRGTSAYLSNAVSPEGNFLTLYAEDTISMQAFTPNAVVAAFYEKETRQWHRQRIVTPEGRYGYEGLILRGRQALGVMNSAIADPKANPVSPHYSWRHVRLLRCEDLTRGQWVNKAWLMPEYGETPLHDLTVGPDGQAYLVYSARHGVSLEALKDQPFNTRVARIQNDLRVEDFATGLHLNNPSLLFFNSRRVPFLVGRPETGADLHLWQLDPATFKPLEEWQLAGTRNLEGYIVYTLRPERFGGEPNTDTVHLLSAKFAPGPDGKPGRTATLWYAALDLPR